MLAEALAEAPGVLRRVSVSEPDDLGLIVGQRALGDFPHLVGDLRRLVIDDDDALALVVEAGERFGVVLGPRHGVRAPALFVAGDNREYPGLGDLPPIAGDREIAPLDDLRPQLGSDLRLGVGGDDDARILVGIERPVHDHSDVGRLADAVA
jgi:hypothetical protein